MTLPSWVDPPRHRRVGAPDDPEWQELRRLLRVRADSRCECCGLYVVGNFDAAHRRPRSGLGPNTLNNLLFMLPAHHKAAHNNPAEAYARGIHLKDGSHWDDTPVLLHGKRWVLLDGLNYVEIVKEPGDGLDLL